MNGIAKKLKLSRTYPLHLMLLPGLVLLVIFCYTPMVGLVISFQYYLPTKGFFGSEWIGLDNYKFLFSLHDFYLILRNTVLISFGKIILGIVTAVSFALLLNEVAHRYLKKFSQTIVFFPHFLSWVILGGIFVDIFSLKGGINKILGTFGIEAVFFLSKPWWFMLIVILTDVWKSFGYSSIIYYAAIVHIDPTLYEAAKIDGANRLQQILRITLPSIAPIIMVMTLLALGNILNAGFDQLFNMYNPLVYETGDIIDTYVYRIGIISGQFSLATAVGLFKSIVGMILISTTYWAADRFANYRII